MCQKPFTRSEHEQTIILVGMFMKAILGLFGPGTNNYPSNKAYFAYILFLLDIHYQDWST